MKTMTMTRFSRGVGLGFLFACATGALAGIGSPGALLLAKSQAESRPQVEVKGSLKDRLAVSNQQFMENKGQWSKAAKFLARYDGFNLWLTASGWKLDQLGPVKDNKRTGHVVEVAFAGGNPKARLLGAEPSSTRTDFFRKNKEVRGVRRTLDAFECERMLDCAPFAPLEVRDVGRFHAIGLRLGCRLAIEWMSPRE